MENNLWGTVPCVKITIKQLDDGKFHAIVWKQNDVGGKGVAIDEQSAVRRLLRLTEIIEAAEDDEELERLLHQIETYWELIREREK